VKNQRSGYAAGHTAGTAMLRPSSSIVDAILAATSERASGRNSTRRDATLIYHASTYDVDGSRTLRDKTDRRQLAVAVRELSRDRATHRVVYASLSSSLSPLRYFSRETNKTWLINKCITIYRERERSERATRRKRAPDNLFPGLARY